VFSAYCQFDALDRQTDVTDPVDKEASVGYAQLGNVTSAPPEKSET